jgi:hypothetical protein
MRYLAMVVVAMTAGFHPAVAAPPERTGTRLAEKTSRASDAGVSVGQLVLTARSFA